MQESEFTSLHMQITSQLCSLLVVCSLLELYRKSFQYVLGSLFMDSLGCLKYLALDGCFGCGFFLFGSFRQVFDVLCVLFLFGLGIKLLQSSRGESGELKLGFRSKVCLDSEKIASCKCGVLRLLKNFSPPMVDKFKGINKKLSGDSGDDDFERTVVSDDECDDNDEAKSDTAENDECNYDENEEFDVVSLRKLVKIERRRADAACSELEKERMAAATAAEEAMAMILRLQNEKSLVEMESNQYRRLAEEKQLHDQEVIQSLQWLVLKHESERSALEDQLGLCKRKLKRFGKSNILEGGEESLGTVDTEIEDVLNHPGLFSSLDMKLSPDKCFSI